MKINSLLESQTQSSATANTTSSAPEFGRDDEHLEECGTTSGAVASVDSPIGKMQRRGKGSIFSGIKTSDKFPNSKVVKEGAYQDGVRDGIQGQANPRASSIYGPESSEYSRGYEDGLVKGKEKQQANVASYQASLTPYKEIPTEELQQMLRDIRKRTAERQAIYDKYRGSSRFSDSLPPNSNELKQEHKKDHTAWQAIHQELFQRGVSNDQRMEEARKANTKTVRAGLSKREKRVDPTMDAKKQSEQDAAWERLQAYMNNPENKEVLQRLATKEGSLNEFAPSGGDEGDDGFSEETLKMLAAQWYNGDEDPRVERTLMAAGWEIGQDEGYDDEPGVFVVQRGDVNGNSYMSWPAHELQQGVDEAVTLDRSKNPNYPNDPATFQHHIDSAKAILSDPKSDPDSRKAASAILAKHKSVAEDQLDEKSKSQAQFRTMAAVAHNPKFAKKVGISQKVGKEFHKADKGSDYSKLPSKVDEAEISEDMLAHDLYRDLQIFKKGADKDIGSKAKDKDISSKAKDKEIINKVKKATNEDKDPCWKGYKQIGMKDKAGKKVPNCVPVKEEEVSEDWQKTNRKDKTDGMSPKAVKAYRRENPGSKLQTAVTKKPSELKAGSKDAKRRKSFCARMSGNPGPMKDEHGKPTPKAKALKRWNC